MEKVDYSVICRWLMTALGGVLTTLEPTLPYILICTVVILIDCYTAWQLSRRVKKAHPDKTKPDSGKFNSHNAGKVLMTLIKSYALIILAYFISVHITDFLGIDLAKIAAGCICFWQLWSILENESSCNGARWAKVLQKVMVDKTERHFDLDLSDFKTPYYADNQERKQGE